MAGVPNDWLSQFVQVHFLQQKGVLHYRPENCFIIFVATATVVATATDVTIVVAIEISNDYHGNVLYMLCLLRF